MAQHVIYQGEAEALILQSADIEGVVNGDLDNFDISIALSQQMRGIYRRDCNCGAQQGYLEWSDVKPSEGVVVVDITAEHTKHLPVGVYALGIRFVAKRAHAGVAYREISDYIEVKPSIFIR